MSVLVPARDEAASLPAALASIAAQDYAGEIEVVVADGSHGIATARAARAALPGVRIVPNPRRLAASGMNRALAAARHGIVARCDARCTLPPDYLRRAVAALQASGAANVGGRLAVAGRTPFERAVALAMASRIGSGGPRYRTGGPAGPVDSVPLGVYRRAALERVGGFDEGLARNEDYELNWRLRQAGGLVLFDPALRVSYRPRGGVRALARQYYDYGRWKRVVLRRHPRSLRARHLAAPALVAGLASSALGAAAGGAVGWTGMAAVAGVLPAAWLMALGGAAAAQAVQGRDPAALAMAGPLAIMHLAWGAGFLAPGEAPGPSPRPVMSASSSS